MIDELERELARRSPAGYAQVLDPYYRANWHHTIISDAMARVAAFESRRVIITAPPRAGKALHVDTPILTTAGFKAIKDVRIGDQVFGSGGEPVKVIGKSPIFKDRALYAVRRQIRQAPVLCDGEHAWTTTHHGTMTTKALYDGALREVWIPRTPPIRFEHPAAPRVSPVDGFEIGRAVSRAMGRFMNPLSILMPRATKEAIIQGSLESSRAREERAGGVYTVICGDEEAAAALASLARSIGYDAIRPETAPRLVRVSTRRQATERGQMIKIRQAFEPATQRGVKMRGDTVCIQVAAEDQLYLAGRDLLPTHNSEIVSRAAPAWMLGHDPTLKIISASYAQDLSRSMAKAVKRRLNSRKHAQVFGEFLPGDTDTQDQFDTEQGGQYKATSVGGPVTGFGANVIILDDLMKGRAEAESEINRNKTWDWFQDDIMSRLEWPNAVVLMFTRWNVDDPVGRVLEQDAEEWEVINLPAIYEGDEGAHPLDPRSEGEPLWPGYFQSKEERRTGGVDRDELVRRALAFYEKEREKNPYGFSSIYQGRPTLKEGGMFRREWVRHYRIDPVAQGAMCSEQLISVDATFGSSKRSDKVAITVAGLLGHRIMILDEDLRRMDYPETKQAIREMARRWPRATVLIESKANGQALIDDLRADFPRVVGYNPRDTKQARAQLAADRMESGNVLFPLAQYLPTVGDYIEDLVGFPQRRFDDRVDALSQICVRWERREDPRHRLLRIVSG